MATPAVDFSHESHRLLLDAAELRKPTTSLIYGVRATPATTLAEAVRSMEATIQQWCDRNPASNVVLTKQSVAVAASHHEYMECEHGLTADEIGAIHLYSQERPVYPVVSAMLRDENRVSIRPLFSYLRLLLGALAKLPKKSGSVYRGMNGLISDTFTAEQKSLPLRFVSNEATIAPRITISQSSFSQFSSRRHLNTNQNSC